jgi:hypothetical protein
MRNGTETWNDVWTVYTHTHVYVANIHTSCVEMEKNNSGVLASEENNNTVQYTAESDRNLAALCKELISVAQLGLVRGRYGGVSTVSMREEVVQTTVVRRTLAGYHGAVCGIEPQSSAVTNHYDQPHYIQIWWAGIAPSVTRLATGWTGRGSNTGGGGGRDFPHPSRPGLGPNQPTTQ